MSTLENYRAWLVRRGRERSANRYCIIVRRWIEGPDEFLETITSSNYTPNYRRSLIAAVKSWAKFTEDEDLRKQLEDIRMPAAVPASAREPLTKEEWARVRRAIDDADFLTDAQRNVCALIALRGIRCGDVLRLTKRDITQALKTGVLAFESKGERWQRFNARPLRVYLEGLLEDWGRGKKYKRVCNLISPGSKPANAQESAGRSIRSAFDRIAKFADFDSEDLYAHRFRHTYATLFLQTMQGDPEALPKLQQQMGWARLDTASNYLRRSRQEELDAVESEMFDGEV